MTKTIISFLSLVLTIFAMNGCDNITNDMSFSTSFIKAENKQKNINIYSPNVLYQPKIYIQIINPLNGNKETVSATIDTGSDNCFISRKLANYLGLKQTDEPPITIYTADGSIEAYAVEAEYTLANEKKERVENFPIQETHFYINEANSYHIILGFIGFIDRFKEIKIRYPHNIQFIW